MKDPTPEMWDLMEAVVDDHATTIQVDRLGTILQKNSDTHLPYISFMDMHAQILWALGRGGYTTPTSKPAAPAKLKWILLFLFLFGAASITVAVWLLTGPEREQVRILAASNASWSNGQRVIVGEVFDDRALQLDQGVAEIGIGEKIRILVEAPSCLYINDDTFVLERGKVVASINRPGRPVVFMIGNTKISAEHARLGISVSDQNLIEIHMFDNTALLNDKRKINAGECINVDGDIVKDSGSDPKMFLHSMEGWHLNLPGNYETAILEDRPVDYYRCQGLSGITLKNMVNENRNAQVTGDNASIQATSRVSNRYLGLNTSGPAKTTSLMTDFALHNHEGDFTLELWINPLNIKGGTILSAERGLNLRLVPANNGRNNPLVMFTIYSTAGEEKSITIGDIPGQLRWIHLLITRKGDRLSGLINGKTAATISLPPEFRQHFPARLIIGGKVNGGKVTDFFQGYLDEIAVYDYSIRVDRGRTHYDMADICHNTDNY